MKDLTTGQIAKICKVAPRTVGKWFDSGRLKGYRIPGSQDRRVPRPNLGVFLRENGMPLDEFERMVTARILVIAHESELTRLVFSTFAGESSFKVERVPNVFDAGMTMKSLQPDAIIIDCDNASLNILQVMPILRRKPELAEAIFVLLLPEGSEFARCDICGQTENFQKPFDPKLLAERLRTIIGVRKELV